MATTYAIPDGRTVMAATTYNGNSSTQSIANTVNGVSFAPDFVWIKDRNTARSHRLFDTVRGATLALFTDATSAESTLATDLTAFNSTGFALGAGAGSNATSETYVGWQWNAGGSTVTNTSGSISAQVRANTTAGFSVVTYTGTGANATVGHGLGVAPSMIIVKNRSSGTTDWAVYHKNLTSAAYYLWLNSTQAQATSAIVWNSTTPTSSVFSIGTGSQTNGSTNSMVAYCFAPVAGYSAFGSYTGNGSADGPFVYCGFRPRFFLIKNASSIYDWYIHDTSRDTYNTMNKELYPNTSDAEVTSSRLFDGLSNGFKVRDSNAGINANGSTYIYMAFAENPLKYANAR